MIKVIVASTNPVKLEAVQKGFARLFPEEPCEVGGFSVPSGVSDQPMSDKETLAGARNRARKAREFEPGADFWVGVEGGCDYHEGDLVAFAWVQVLSVAQAGNARTAQFRLPPRVQALVESGKELGEADDLVFGQSNSKQQSGAVGLLTDGAITRATYYEQAVILALLPFKNPDLY